MEPWKPWVRRILGALFVELLKIFWHLATFDHSGPLPRIGVASMLIISNCCIILFRLLLFIRNWFIPGLLLPSSAISLTVFALALAFAFGSGSGRAAAGLLKIFLVVLLAFAFGAFIGEEVTPGALLAAALALPAAFALTFEFAFTLALAFAFGAAVSKNLSQLLEQLLLEKPVLQILVLGEVEAKQA